MPSTILRNALAVTAMSVLAACSSSGQPEQAPTTSGQSSHPGSAASTGPTSSAAAPDPTAAVFNDPAVVAKVLADAAHGVEVVNSYDYRTLGQYLSKADAVTTPKMQSLLSASYLNTLKPNAPKARAVQVAKSNDAGIVSLDLASNTARVLVYGQLTISNAQTSSPRYDVIGVLVSMRLVAGSWRIDSYAADSTAGGAATPPGTAELVRATNAAGVVTARILTFHRATFAADFSKALAGTTGTLHSDLQSKRAETQSTITSGKFDLTGIVDSVAVYSAQPGTVKVMITLTGNKVADVSSNSSSSIQRLIVTMTKSGGVWLAGELESVGIS